jgi:hypothetical protein
MAQSGKRRRPVDATPGVAEQTPADVSQGGESPVWVRADGALCVGNECIVIKRGEDRQLNVEINRNGGCEVDALAELVWDTIGRGGDTNFKVKGHLESKPKNPSGKP